MKTIANSIALIILLVGSVAQAAIYNAQTDFTAGGTNPNGVWSYGYSTATLGSTFNPMLGYSSDGNGFAWTGPDSGFPVFFKRTAPGTLNGVDSGETGLHPGPSGTLGILRFTAPVAGIYSVTATWETGDLNGGSGNGRADYYLLLNYNAASPAFSTLNTFDSETLLTGFVLGVGDTVELIVGAGQDGYTYDSTPVNLIMAIDDVAAVPEPASMAIWGLGALGCAIAGYRRRKAA